MSDQGWPPWEPRRSSSEFDDPLEYVRRYWKQGVGVLIAVLVLLVLWTVWFRVEPEQQAVVQRFGAAVRTVGPGLQFKWPWPVESVTLVPVQRVLKQEFGFRTVAEQPARYESRPYKDESLMLTRDLNVIDVQWIVQYQIEKPVQYLFEVRNPEKTIRDVSEAVMRRVVGNRDGSAVLTVDRIEIAAQAKVEIQQVLNEYETGIRLVTVELQDVTPPEPVAPAFNEVNEARQDKERIINQAQERANREIPKARGQANQSIREAEGYALQRVNRAQGEASRFVAILQEYRQAPEVTRQRLYLETVGTFLSDVRGLYIVDQEQKALVPWLPVDGATPAGGR